MLYNIFFFKFFSTQHLNFQAATDAPTNATPAATAADAANPATTKLWSRQQWWWQQQRQSATPATAAAAAGVAASRIVPAEFLPTVLVAARALVAARSVGPLQLLDAAEQAHRKALLPPTARRCCRGRLSRRGCLPNRRLLHGAWVRCSRGTLLSRHAGMRCCRRLQGGVRRKAEPEGLPPDRWLLRTGVGAAAVVGPCGADARSCAAAAAAELRTGVAAGG